MGDEQEAVKIPPLDKNNPTLGPVKAAEAVAPPDAGEPPAEG